MSIEDLKKRAKTVQSQAERLQLKLDCSYAANRCLKDEADRHKELVEIFMLRDAKGEALIKVSSLDTTAFKWDILKNKMRTLLVLAQSGWYHSEIDKIYTLYKGIQSTEDQSVMNRLLSIWRTKILIEAYAEPIAVSAMVCLMVYLSAPFWVFAVLSGIMAASCAAGILLSAFGEMLFFPSYPNVVLSDDLAPKVGDQQPSIKSKVIETPVAAPAPVLL